MFRFLTFELFLKSTIVMSSYIVYVALLYAVTVIISRWRRRR